MLHHPVPLTDAARTAMLAAADAAWPREMVGLVGGRGAIVTDLLTLANVAIAGDRFAVEPAAFATAVAEFERRGVTFLGFVHSHPNGKARLSDADQRELWRNCLQFVVGARPNGHHELACFAIAGDEIRELRIIDPRP